MSIERRDHLGLELSLGALGAALVLAAIAFASVGIPPLPRAPLLALGLPTPLSGMTRSFVAMASGDIRAAFSWHPLGPSAFVACIGLAVLAVASWLHGRRFRAVARLAADRRLWVVVVGALAVAWARQIVVLG